MAGHRSFSYALFDLGETELLGCVHVNPSDAADADADICWWVVDWLVDGPIERALDSFVPAWVSQEWPIARPRFLSTRASHGVSRSDPHILPANHLVDERHSHED